MFEDQTVGITLLAIALSLPYHTSPPCPKAARWVSTFPVMGSHLVPADKRHDVQQVEHVAVAGAERMLERLQRERAVRERQPAELAALGPRRTVAAILGRPLGGRQVSATG